MKIETILVPVDFSDVTGEVVRYATDLAGLCQSRLVLLHISEPEPDLALVQPRKDLYAERHPHPQDVLLIVEVADTTLLTDRNVKIPLYARFGIPESWLVNLTKKLIEIHYDVEDGHYRNQLKFEKGETLMSPTVPDLTLKVDDIIA